jgi:hypothetical protein
MGEQIGLWWYYREDAMLVGRERGKREITTSEAWKHGQNTEIRNYYGGRQPQPPQ